MVLKKCGDSDDGDDDPGDNHVDADRRIIMLIILVRRTEKRVEMGTRCVADVE